MSGERHQEGFEVVAPSSRDPSTGAVSVDIASVKKMDDRFFFLLAYRTDGAEMSVGFSGDIVKCWKSVQEKFPDKDSNFFVEQGVSKCYSRLCC